MHERNSSQGQHDYRQYRPPQRWQWEYLTKCMDVDSDLTQAGAEGWELTTALLCGDGMATFYFKRRRF